MKLKNKIVHIISGLTTGGAEMMLFKLLSVSTFNNVVISMGEYKKRYIEEKIVNSGVKVYFLGLKPGNILNKMKVLHSIIKIENPDIIQGWMYHGNLLSVIAGLMSRKAIVFWNVRHSLHDLKKEKFAMRQLIRLNALCSKIPDRIIYNSRTAAAQHVSYGYRRNKTVVIPNGFDKEKFAPNNTHRVNVRRKYKIKEDEIVLGHIARFHPMKGHIVFIGAMKILTQRYTKLKAMLIGSGVHEQNLRLTRLINQQKLEGQVLLLGECSNISELIAGFDIAVSASLWGEGFSNTIGEAMATGIPCVATDVGDSRWILDGLGKVVLPGDEKALAQACIEFIEMGAEKRDEIGRISRERLINNFSLSAVVNKYDTLWRA